MKLRELTAELEIRDTSVQDFDCAIREVTHQSEAVEEGDLFICVRGMQHDGHQYIDRAVFRGARVVVLEEGVPEPSAMEFLRSARNVDYMVVANTRDAMARLYSARWGHPARRMHMTAVTGTNGKTTTVYMLDAILREAGLRSAMIGTITDAMTTPDPDVLYRHLAQLADAGTEYVTMEASSHALALDKLSPIAFEQGIFTNLTPEHLDFHGTMENYCAAKAKLFTQCRCGLFNYDSEYGRRLYFGADCEKRFYSVQSSAADFSAQGVVNRGIDGVLYHVMTDGGMFRVCSPMPGEFTVYNSLAAVSSALLRGIDSHTIRGAISRMQGVPGRLQRVPAGERIAVFIDYAHTPDALENVLRGVRRFMKSTQRLVVLFGCGGNRDRSKRPVMASIACRLADFVVVTSDNCRCEEPGAIIAEILTGMRPDKPQKVIEDRREAILWTIRNAREGDVILLAGKGHENYEIRADGKHPFSEADIVAEALS